MTPAIRLHTQLAPKRPVRRATEEEIKQLLVRAQDEIDRGYVRVASALLTEAIEAMRT